MSAAPELRALTGMRGIAAWGVVLYHIRLGLDWAPRPVIDVLAKGYLAVDFFFLLSGFVIWLAWADRLRAGESVLRFWQKRVARIWPLHAAVLAFGVALALLLAATGRADWHTFPPAELPLHLLLVQNWGFTAELSWNDPAWSISCELAAYLLFPLLALSLDWRRVPSWAVLASIAALIVLLWGVYAAAGQDTLKHEIARLGLIRCLLEFAAGSAVGALWWRWRDRSRRPAIAAAAVAALAIAAPLPETLTAPAAFAALLLALALTAGARHHPLEGRLVHWLGEISYATYLSHYLLWFAFKLVFVRDPLAVPPQLVALYLVGVLAASAVLYHGLERPAQRWLNALGMGGGTHRRPGALAGQRSGTRIGQDRLQR